MIRLDPVARLWSRSPGSLVRWTARPLAWGVLLGCLVTLVGCHKPQIRSQSDEDNERDRYPVRTVGEITTFGNAEPLPIGGVGLVTGLEGTGGPAPNSSYRTLLENDLKKQRVENIKEVLNSPNNSLVLISASIPPGARKGDKIDVEITLPPGSKTTSLRGGYLHTCQLYNYDYAKNLNPNFDGTNKAILGHAVAKCEGAVLVGFGSGDEAASLKQGRIWDGAKLNIDMPFHLILNQDQQYARIANDIANHINGTFHGSTKGLPDQEVAAAKNNVLVMLSVPPQYKHNMPRFLRVVRMVPLRENVSSDGKQAESRVPYRTQLQEDLLDPARTVTATLRLEALGQNSIPVLKSGLQSKHPLVRFCAAESLAYLGSPACGEELARVVQQQPYLRAFALSAMASLDEAICHVKLKELMLSAVDAETRYGAFRALRALDETDPDVRGELLNDSFHLHQIQSEGEPLVHLSLSRRPEIVCFGAGPALKPPFSLLAGSYAITASPEDQRCTISHYDLHGEGGGCRERCSLKVADLIHKLAEMGANYAEIIEVLRQANNCQNLTCQLRYDALPQAITVQELAEAGKVNLDKVDSATVQIIRPTSDMGSTPTLYERNVKRSVRDADLRALTQPRDKKSGPAVGQLDPPSEERR